MAIFTEILSPVLHTQLGEQVQLCTHTFAGFAGFLGGIDKFDTVGEWEISDKWTRKQATALGKHVAGLRRWTTPRVTRHADGISRVLKYTY